MITEKLSEAWETPTSHIRILDDETFVIAKRLMFHWMLVRGYAGWGGSLTSYDDRYCYQTEEGVLEALSSYPQEGGKFEPKGWHRHPPTHRRRPDGDASKEYIDP